MRSAFDRVDEVYKTIEPLHISVVVLYSDLYLGFVLFPEYHDRFLEKDLFSLLRYSTKVEMPPG